LSRHGHPRLASHRLPAQPGPQEFGVPDGAYIRAAHDHARQGKFDVAPQDFTVFTESRKP